MQRGVTPLVGIPATVESPSWGYCQKVETGGTSDLPVSPMTISILILPFPTEGISVKRKESPSADATPSISHLTLDMTSAPAPISPSIISALDKTCAPSQPTGSLSYFLETSSGPRAYSADFESQLISPGLFPCQSNVFPPFLITLHFLENNRS